MEVGFQTCSKHFLDRYTTDAIDVINNLDDRRKGREVGFMAHVMPQADV
jgi:hypothetical protein